MRRQVGDREQLEAVGAIVGRAATANYWHGAFREKALSLIENLPIALPQNDEYLFQLKGSVLFISEAKRGISQYRLTDAAGIRSITFENDGMHLELAGYRDVTEVVLLRDAVAISSQAITLRDLTAPIDLLNAYSDLRVKAKTATLSSVERSQLDQLIDKIGDEYEQHRRKRVMPSSRSTPQACGESRSPGYRSSGG
jgi:hypothetical protein